MNTIHKLCARFQFSSSANDEMTRPRIDSNLMDFAACWKIRFNFFFFTRKYMYAKVHSCKISFFFSLFLLLIFSLLFSFDCFVLFLLWLSHVVSFRYISFFSSQQVWLRCASILFSVFCLCFSSFFSSIPILLSFVSSSSTMSWLFCRRRLSACVQARYSKFIRIILSIVVIPIVCLVI